MQFEWPIIGHETLINNLQKSLAIEKIAHAYIFYGPSNIGKKTLVQSFFYSLLCQDKDIRPCKQCIHCKQIEKNIHPDIYQISKKEDKKNIVIDQIRQLQEKLNRGSLLNSYKIAIIKDAESLTAEAANSLLKTLEEPYPKTIIILIATQIDDLPNTIKSRCQTYKLYPVPKEKIYNYLISRGLKRKLADEISNLVWGRIGLGIAYMNDKDLLKKEIKSFKKLLRIFNVEIFKRLDVLGDFSNLNSRNLTMYANKFFVDALKIIRDLILIKTGLNQYISCSFMQNDLEKISKTVSLRKLLKMYNIIISNKNHLNFNVNPKLLIENIIIDL